MYQKLYLDPEIWRKKYDEQQKELLKYRNCYRGSWTTNKNSQDGKIKLSNIKFDEEKLRNLLSERQNRKPRKKGYNDDVYSDDGIETHDKFSENGD